MGETTVGVRIGGRCAPWQAMFVTHSGVFGGARASITDPAVGPIGGVMIGYQGIEEVVVASERNPALRSRFRTECCRCG